MQRNDEHGLIERAQQRDAEAFTELYRRHVDRIFRYVLLRVGDAPLAEDLTSEVFIRALESLGAYQDRGAPFAAWLYRIAKSRVIDHWRRAGRQQVPFEAVEVETSVEMPGGDVIAYRVLAQALQRLTDEQQEVIILKYVEGHSLTEIAEITGRTEGAVKAMQHRALASLARLMEP